ncbi:MAG: hypothetical protein AAGH76_06255 [Pseudomonadota bacterium]
MTPSTATSSQPLKILKLIHEKIIDRIAYDDWANERSIERSVVVSPDANTIRTMIRESPLNPRVRFYLFEEQLINVDISDFKETPYGLLYGGMFATGRLIDDANSQVVITVNFDDSVSLLVVAESLGRIELAKLKNSDQHVLWQHGVYEVDDYDGV